MRRFFAWTLLFCGFGVPATAQIVLADGNSRATIDPTSNGFPFRRGLNSWEVDGVDHVFQQWYWFRIGETPERSIDTIGDPSIAGQTDNSVNVAYSNPAISIDITFTLVGGTAGSGTADLGEIVRIVNRSNATLELHLFEYDDFDVSGTFDDDVAVRLDSSSIRQSDSRSRVTVGTVPAADHWQISEIPDLFDLLSDDFASNLGDGSTLGGPGDLAFAFQWDRTLAPGETFLMSKNKLVTAVPEPASLIGVALGITALARRRRRRKH